MFRLFSQKKKELKLLLEVQSGLVRGALVASSHGAAPRIIYVVTRSIPVVSDIESTRIVKMLLKAVHDVMVATVKDGMARAQAYGFGKRSIQTVHYIFSSPWIISESKTVTIPYETDTEIEKETVQKIVDDECRILAEKYAMTDAENIEQKIFEVKLNGYAVTHFDGRKAKKLEVSFATSVSSTKFLRRIENEVHRVLHIPKKQYHSALLLQYNGLRTLSEKQHAYIYVHVHDELTDIIVVKGGLCVQLSSLPFGAQTLVRKVSNSLKQPLQTTESFLKLLHEGTLEESEALKLRKVISHVIQKWKVDFFTALTANIAQSLVPRSLYLSAHIHFEVFRDIILIENEFNFEIISYDDMPEKPHFEFDKASEHSRMIEMYAFSLESMI